MTMEGYSGQALLQRAGTLGVRTGMTVQVEMTGPNTACLTLEGPLFVAAEEEALRDLKQLIAEARQVDAINSGDRVRLSFHYDLSETV